MVNPLIRRQANLERLGLLGPRATGGSVVTYNPRAAVAQARAVERARPQGDGMDALRNAVRANAPQQERGGGGFLGSVLNNPIAKTALAPLQAIDVPRRVVASALQEGIDLFGSGDASLGDLINQSKDASFGFGTIMGDATGNKWADRLIGFAGDVLLDPLTYVTFGANKFAGAPGRLAAATKLAEAGGDAAALSRVGRLGVLGARGAEREAIFAGMKGAESLAEPGLRFAGQRIPGTGRLAEGIGGGLARTRAGIADRIPESLRDVRVPRGLEAEYATLRSGSGDARSALQVIAGSGRREGSSGLFGARWASKADRVAREAKKADGQTIFRMLDGEIPLEGEAGVRAREFLEAVYTDAKQTATGLPHREDFVPHLWTKEARDKLTDRPLVVNGQTLDVTQGTGSALRRNIGPNSKVELPDGRVVSIETGFASEINDKLGPILGVSKVVEDDFAKVVKPYVLGIAETVGRADMMQRISEIGTPGARVIEELDQRATVRAGKPVARRADRVAKSATKRGERVGRDLARTGVQAQEGLVEAAQGRLTALQDELGGLGAADSVARRAERGLGTVRRGVEREFDDATRSADKELTKLAAERSQAEAASFAKEDRINDLRRSGKRTRDRERIAAKRAGETPPSGPIPATEAARRAQSQVERTRLRRMTEFDARLEGINESITRAEREAQEQVAQIDAARYATREHQMTVKQREFEIKSEIKKVREALKKAERLKPVPKKATANAYVQVQRDLGEVAKLVGTFDGADTVADLLSDYGAKVAKLTKAEESAAAAARISKVAQSGELTPVLRSVVADGFERIGEGILSEADAPIVKAQVAEMLRNFDAAVKDSGFWPIVDNYTKFFKTYATATPGFHVRNGMSAAFMNATDGVSVRNMQRGATLWRKFEKNPQAFTDNLPRGVTREQAEDAIRAVFQSGGGQGQFGQAEVRLGSNPITNNPFTRASQTAGGYVEGIARAGMALDTILAGGTVDEAAARITRIHFDYSQVSKLDQKAKRLIPFWTFMSRNVPLQMQQMLLRPRVYQGYRSLVRNMGEDYDRDLVPLYWQESGAFKVTDDKYLAPDLPFVRLEDDLTKLTTDPQRLLADANPILKVPLETLVAKRRFFQDRPFEENQFEAVDDELTLLKPLLQLLGQTKTSGSGETVVDERLGYAIRNLLPPISQYQRLLSNDPYYEERRGQSAAGYLGVPLKTLTEGQQRNEARRRAYEKRDEEAARRALLEFQSR